ncbi:MAG TPA: hypothetical protein VHG51_02405 [Longimicrobiaceae bacterium]|nr:hypothetical protein [Longimicrobiaceae bacterium]
MSAPADAGTLTRIPGTALYTPPGRETWVFLLWDAAGAKDTLPLRDTWADRGTPQRPGWYVFLRAVPAAAHAPELEAALRGDGGLPAPSATGWAWSAWASGPGAELRGRVAVRPDEASDPVVAEDAPVAFPKGVTEFGFAAGLRVASTRDGAGEVDGLVVARPALPDEPWVGIRLPLAGPLAGCIVFGALLESTVSGEHSRKQAADVRLDPLRPFDPARTRTTPTGAEYLLVAEGDGKYRLEPYPPA